MVPTGLIKDNIPDIRFLYDLKDVLYDQEWLKNTPNFEVYYMYRGLFAGHKDKQMMDSGNLRYDITIIVPRMLGVEYPKTLGHEHAVIANRMFYISGVPPAINGTNLTYPEIYEVLQGEGEFFIQKRNGDKIEDAYVVKARQGEKVIVPPNYAHITINASGKELIIANWSEKNFKSDYRPIKEKQGACYYALSPNVIARSQVRLGDEAISSHDNEPPPVILSESAEGGEPKNLVTDKINWIKNKNYSAVPDLKTHQASDFNNMFQKFGINPQKPMYELVNEIEKLDFLKNPQKYE